MLRRLKLNVLQVETGGVLGGTHRQILLRACTVYKSGSLPESSRTNPTPDNFVFHTIVYNTNLNIFFSRFSITVIFIFMYSLRYKKKYITFFIIWFYNFQYSQDVHFMFTIFSLVQKNYQNFVFEPLKKHLYWF